MTDGHAHDDGGDESTRTGADRNDLHSEDSEHTNADPFATTPTAHGTPDPESFHPDGDAQQQGDDSGAGQGTDSGTDTRSGE